MDALGFGFENYDVIGKYRTKDGNLPIDATADLPGGKKFTGSSQLKAILMGQKEEFAKSFVEKLMTYAIGRGVDVQDKCFVDSIVKSSASSGYKMSDIVVGIVNSEPFRKRKSEGVQ